MVDISKLKEEELNSLSEEDVFNLESLIVDGADAKIPITIKFPRADGRVVKAAAMIRPLTNIEWNNCVRLNRVPNDNTTNEVELLKKALYTKEGEQFPPHLVEKIPNGVVLELINELARISGVDVEENMKYAKVMLGF